MYKAGLLLLLGNRSWAIVAMLLRVRSDRGTLPIRQLSSSSLLATVQERVQEHYGVSCLARSLSKDPAGNLALDLETTLHQNNLQHGDMIYCRVEHSPLLSTSEHLSSRSSDIQVTTRTSTTASQELPQDQVIVLEDDDTNSTNHAATSNAKSAQPETIDLLDDLSDEDEDPKLSSTSKRAPTSRSSPTRKKRYKPIVGAQTTSLSTLSETRAKLRLASYNVWFGEPHQKARMKGIVDALEPCFPLDCIALQEVTPNLFRYLSPLLGQHGYQLFAQPGIEEGMMSYGVAWAIHQNVQITDRRFLPFSNSQQGRGLLVVETHDFLLCTTHLESYTGPQSKGGPERQVQLERAASYCQNQLSSDKAKQAAIIVGDLNWDDERPRSAGDNVKLSTLLPPSKWKDAWLECRQSSKENGYTYDAKTSPMLGGQLRRRFDRCLLYSTKWKSESVQIVGQGALPGLEWNKVNPYTNAVRTVPVTPSDHFGLVVSLCKS